MNLSISLSDVDVLKGHLMALLPHAKSSHRVEAMARGLGFGSNAALLARVSEGPAPCSIDNRAFVEFLKPRDVSDVPYDTLAEAIVRTKLSHQRAAIQAILDREPEISANGYRTFDSRRTIAENRASFLASREGMLDAHKVGQFMRAVAFLETKEKAKTVSRKGTSYGYKHEAERFHNERAPGEDPYVANGLFIAAALHLGFTVKRDGNSPNAYINIARPAASRSRSGFASTLRGPKKRTAWRNMMVAGLNAGLDQGLFGLAVDANYWEGNSVIYRFEFDGMPAIAHLNDAGFGELALHVALLPTDRAHEMIGAFNAGFAAGEAFASGWFERERGAWLQTSGSATGSIRAALLDRVAEAQQTPKGYADNGKFMM